MIPKPVDIIVTTLSPWWLIVAWVALVGGGIAATVATHANVSTIVLLLAIGVSPALLVVILSDSAPHPTVAEILYAVHTTERPAMIRTRTFGVLVALVFSALTVHGQRAAHYRDFQLGANVASVLSLSGAPASDVTTVHDRPVIQQELEWHRPYTIGGATDSVQQIAFSFFDDQLFRLVIDYDRERTDGMTNADMIDAISRMYGATNRPAARATSAPIDRLDQTSGMRVATWGNAEFVAVLYRSSYASGFRLIVTATQVSARARSAEAEAARLDVRDAPERERARLKKEADDARAVQDKARLANKATFVP